MIKEDQPQLREAVEEWIVFCRRERACVPPDWKEVDKGHGRLEVRRLWIVPCEADMEAYLAETFGWPGVQWCGWIERWRRSLSGDEKGRVQVSVWVAGGAFRWPLTARQAAALLRGHWGIENGVFYVRDVTMDEDRLHGRRIAAGLSGIRNVALNLLRHLVQAPYIPDARRIVAAMPDFGLRLLSLPLLEL